MPSLTPPRMAGATAFGPTRIPLRNISVSSIGSGESLTVITAASAQTANYILIVNNQTNSIFVNPGDGPANEGFVMLQNGSAVWEASFVPASAITVQGSSGGGRISVFAAF